MASAIGHPFLAFPVAVASALCLAGEVDAGVRLLGSGLVALGRLDDGRAMLERSVDENARVGCLRWERIARQRLAALDPSA